LIALELRQIGRLRQFLLIFDVVPAEVVVAVTRMLAVMLPVDLEEPAEEL
jgi:hypothetical protein